MRWRRLTDKLFGPGAEGIETFAEATDASGNDRLLLRFIHEPSCDPPDGGKAYNFHSLVWRKRSGDRSIEHLLISRSAFEQGGRRRWVSDLESFDSGAGSAIMKVGEEQPPDSQGRVIVEYSWREWDLLNNRDLGTLRICATPFEPFNSEHRGTVP